jgi:hypothetical protein
MRAGRPGHATRSVVRCLRAGTRAAVVALLLTFSVSVLSLISGCRDCPHGDASLPPDPRHRLPDDLLVTYRRLVEAIQAGQAEAVSNLCLAGGVEVTTEERAKGMIGGGYEINMPFVMREFDGEIFAFRRLEPDCYKIETVSSELFFVRTSTAGWRLFRFYDRPLE